MTHLIIYTCMANSKENYLYKTKGYSLSILEMKFGKKFPLILNV